MNGRLGQIGNHAEQPLLSVELRACKAQDNADRAENERRENHQHGRKAGLCGVADIDRRAHQNEQQKLRREPQLAEFLAEACADVPRHPPRQNARHARYGEQTGNRETPLERVFQRDKQKRYTQYNNDFQAAAQPVSVSENRLKKAG